MSRLLVDDVTKTDSRALLNVSKMATISDIVTPTNQYLYASGANELTLVENCVISVGAAGVFKTGNTVLNAANLDVGSAFTVGCDYYVYICDSRVDAQDEQYVISLNSTYPTGWNASNSRKIGGFHYGRCRKVDGNLQPTNSSGVIFGTGWESAVSNGIVPRSVWTLGHRPKCNPEGMVYIGGGTWVDIYLNSDDGEMGLKSEYNCAPMTGTEGMNWYNFVERLAKSGKRLPDYAEFCAYAFGSPAGLDDANTNAWSATTNSGRDVTGSVVNAVSAVGCVDAVGRVWEWLNDLITRAEHAKNTENHPNEAWGWDTNTPLKTGEKNYDVGNIYQYYYNSLAALLAGGYWNDGAQCGANGAQCGARAVDCNNYPWGVYAYTGARGACDSL
jgi:formylglycine-generating enzyme required for sulfatase activity